MSERLPRGGDWWSGGYHYRTVYLPSGFSMIEVIGMTEEKRAELHDPIAQAQAAARYVRERYGQSIEERMEEVGPAYTITAFGGIHSWTREVWHWWQRPRWLWRLLRR